jgi:hypothetical protein
LNSKVQFTGPYLLINDHNTRHVSIIYGHLQVSIVSFIYILLHKFYINDLKLVRRSELNI